MCNTSEDNYLLLFFEEGNIYKIPLQVIINLASGKLASDGDIDLSEALKLAQLYSHAELIEIANALCWDDVRDDADKLDRGHSVGNYELEYPTCWKRVVCTGDIDEFLMNRMNLEAFMP